MKEYWVLAQDMPGGRQYLSPSDRWVDTRDDADTLPTKADAFVALRLLGVPGVKVFRVTPKPLSAPKSHAALARFPAFAEAIRARLEVGAREYGDKSFERAPAELIGEIQQELLDVNGWSFLLWFELDELRVKLAATVAAGEQNSNQ